MEKREPSYTVGGSVNGATTMEKSMEFPQKLKIKLSYDQAIPLLGLYLKKVKTLIQKDTCTPMFIAASFTIAKIWKQPKCPSTDIELRKVVYIYKGILLSHEKE